MWVEEAGRHAAAVHGSRPVSVMHSVLTSPHPVCEGRQLVCHPVCHVVAVAGPAVCAQDNSAVEAGSYDRGLQHIWLAQGYVHWHIARWLDTVRYVLSRQKSLARK